MKGVAINKKEVSKFAHLLLAKPTHFIAYKLRSRRACLLFKCAR